MRTKLWVVKFPGGVLHIIIVQELNNTPTILWHIRIAHIPGFTHVVFQILPAAWRWQTYTFMHTTLHQLCNSTAGRITRNSNKVTREFGMKINVKMMKVLCISQNKKMIIYIDEQQVEEQFRHLGSLISNVEYCTKNIWNRWRKYLWRIRNCLLINLICN